MPRNVHPAARQSPGAGSVISPSLTNFPPGTEDLLFGDGARAEDVINPALRSITDPEEEVPDLKSRVGNVEHHLSNMQCQLNSIQVMLKMRLPNNPTAPQDTVCLDSVGVITTVVMKKQSDKLPEGVLTVEKEGKKKVVDHHTSDGYSLIRAPPLLAGFTLHYF